MSAKVLNITPQKQLSQKEQQRVIIRQRLQFLWQKKYPLEAENTPSQKTKRRQAS